MTPDFIVCVRTCGWLKRNWKASSHTQKSCYYGKSVGIQSVCTIRPNLRQISQSRSACVGTKWRDPHVRERWVTLCSETWVSSLSCLPHETGPIKIPRCHCVCVGGWVCVSVCAHLTGSSASLFMCVINRCVCLHEINLVFCVLPALCVFSLQRERTTVWT